MAGGRVGGSVGMVAAMLLAAAVAGVITLASCGSGGSGGDGGLCGQCGDSDGPCQSAVPAPADDVDFFCPAANGATPVPCNVELACLRKVDSAERVCFPASGQFEQYRCGGARAQRSPATPTPTPTLTPTPTVTATPVGTATGPTPIPTATPACGDGVISPGEDCDGTNLNGQTCLSICGEAGGILSCDEDDCLFDTFDCDGFDCP